MLRPRINCLPDEDEVRIRIRVTYPGPGHVRKLCPSSLSAALAKNQLNKHLKPKISN